MVISIASKRESGKGPPPFYDPLGFWAEWVTLSWGGEAGSGVCMENQELKFEMPVRHLMELSS